MISIDTNVLLRYVVGDVPHLFDAAAEFMASLTPERPGFITMTVIAEVGWVLKSSYGYSKAECLDLLDALVRMPELEFDDGETVVEAIGLARDGADFDDALIHCTGQLYGVSETVTFDRDAARRLGWHDLMTPMPR